MTNATSILETAELYVKSGLSVISVKADGSKSPTGSWKERQENRPTEDELTRDFGNGKQVGIAIVTGNVSGGLEVLDFDDITLFAPFIERCKLAGIPKAELCKFASC